MFWHIGGLSPMINRVSFSSERYFLFLWHRTLKSSKAGE